MRYIFFLFSLLSIQSALAQSGVYLGANLSPKSEFVLTFDSCQTNPIKAPFTLIWNQEESIEFHLFRIKPDTLKGMFSFAPTPGLMTEYDLIFSYSDSLYKPLQIQEKELKDSLTFTHLILDKTNWHLDSICHLPIDSLLMSLQGNLLGYEGKTGCKKPLSDHIFEAHLEEIQKSPRLNSHKLMLTHDLFKESCLTFDQFTILVRLFEFDDYRVKLINTFADQIFEQDSLNQLEDMIFSKFYKSQIQLNNK
ncbi:MAG: hypothetical protein ACJAY8_000607 [Sphingobacteriales bacterium]